MKAGDVVTLKSGGAPFTVVKVEGESATLVRDSGHIEQIIVPVVALKLVKK